MYMNELQQQQFTIIIIKIYFYNFYYNKIVAVGPHSYTLSWTQQKACSLSSFMQVCIGDGDILH